MKFCHACIFSLLFFSSVLGAVNLNLDYLVNDSLLLDTVYTGKRCIAVGEHGVILISDDCQKWQNISSTVNTTLTAVYFINQDTGWIVGHDAIILMTEDGGNSWNQVYSAPGLEAPLLDIIFTDSLNGIAVGGYGLFLQTMDGGHSWQASHFNIVDTDNTLVDQNIDLHFNKITRITNGQLFISAEAGHLFSSGDNGNTWSALETPYQGSYFGLISPDNSQTLLLYGLRGHLYRTEDSGKHWTKITIDTTQTLTGAIVTLSGSVIITGMGGTILVSQDKGVTFTNTVDQARESFSAVIQTPAYELLLTSDKGIKRKQETELMATTKNR